MKSGPVCTGGINCAGDRQLGDFQQVAIDNAGRAVMAYDRLIAGNDTEVRFVAQA